MLDSSDKELPVPLLDPQEPEPELEPALEEEGLLPPIVLQEAFVFLQRLSENYKAPHVAVLHPRLANQQFCDTAAVHRVQPHLLSDHSCT